MPPLLVLSAYPIISTISGFEIQFSMLPSKMGNLSICPHQSHNSMVGLIPPSYSCCMIGKWHKYQSTVTPPFSDYNSISPNVSGVIVYSVIPNFIQILPGL